MRFQVASMSPTARICSYLLIRFVTVDIRQSLSLTVIGTALPRGAVCPAAGPCDHRQLYTQIAVPYQRVPLNFAYSSWPSSSSYVSATISVNYYITNICFFISIFELSRLKFVLCDTFFKRYIIIRVQKLRNCHLHNAIISTDLWHFSD